MDSLKSLMDKKQYDLVLKITENSQDSLALFYRLSALLATGQSQEGLKLINSKREILKTNLPLLMKIHIELLCLLGKFDEAYDEIKYYQELPYENQETEELLQSLPKYIREEEIKQYKHQEVGQDEIRKKLLSKNDNDVLSALDALREQPLDSFVLPLQNVLKSYPKQTVRAFALLLLVAKKYDKEVAHLSENGLINVVPASLEEPFLIPAVGTVNDASQLLQDVYHDPSLTQTAINILSSEILYLYPQKLTYSKEEIIVIFGYLAKDLLKVRDNDLEVLCQEYGLSLKKLQKEINKIKKHLEDF